MLVKELRQGLRARGFVGALIGFQVVMVIAGPGAAEGAVADAMVELVDLLPTLCELGEAEVHHTHFGRSLTPVLADPATPHREFACSEGGFRPD